MKREKIDMSIERQFLTAMIVNKPFLAGTAPHIDISLFEASYVRQVAGWAFEFFAKQKEAPGRSIQPIYHSWVDREKPDQDDAEAVHDFLESLSEEYDRAGDFNVPYLLDEISKYCNRRAATRLADNLNASISSGREDALELITQFRGTRLGVRQGFDPVLDRTVMERAFASPLEPLIEFPGVAGSFLNRLFTRDALIGIQAPEKGGKTFWVNEFCFRALRLRHKVAMFQVGDLSEAQLVMRLAVRMARLPISLPEGPITVRIPTSVKLVKGDEGSRKPEVEFTEELASRAITLSDSIRAQQHFQRIHKLPSDRSYIKTSIHPMYSVNVFEINSILHQWRHEEGFIPDVIAIDYSDILAKEPGRFDVRDKQNETWMALRRLSQEWHACVISPTQSNVDSYDGKTQTNRNFSQDKRKYGHMTGCIGLAQTSKEKEMQVMRLNQFNVRESKFDVRHCLYVAQCLDYGLAYVKGCR